jgi:signal transduction histidine kinase/ligand-binding sensor domain-containing protein/DNA-binding response OmpR family regulator
LVFPLNKIFTALLTVGVLYPMVLVANGIRVKEVTYAQGLTENTIGCIEQDSLGYIWIGTREGLNRYDGYACRNYYPLPDKGNLRNGHIQDIYVDRNSNIWVRNDAGVDCYQPETDSFEPLSIAFGDMQIDNVLDVIESGGIKWLAAENNGLLGLKANQNKVDISINDSGSVHLFCKKDENHFWTFGNRGIRLFNSQKQQFVDDLKVPAVEVRSWAQYKNLLWIGDYSGIWVFDGKQMLRLKNFAKMQGSNYDESINMVVTSMVVSEGKLWVSTDGKGIYTIELGKDISIKNIRTNTSSQSISTDAVRCLYADRDQNMWIGTVHNGVNVLLRWQKKFYNLKYTNETPDAPHGNFSNFQEDKNNQLWAASFDGLCRINQQTMRVEEYVAKGTVINAITIDWNGDIYLGSYNRGLLKYSPSSGTLSGVPSSGNNFFKNRSVTSLLTDHSGNIWIGSQSLYIYDQAEKEIKRVSEGNIASVICLMQDRNQDMWVGTVYGLYHIDVANKLVNHYAADKAKPFRLSSSWINTLYEDRDGNIWVGTNGGGLNKISRDNHEIKIIRDESLSSQVVHGIAQDKKGQIWFTTNSGLVAMNAGNGDLEVFDYADGLINNQYIDDSMFLTYSGKLLCGGEKGIDYFYPEQIKTNPNPPRVILNASLLENEKDAKGQAAKELVHMNINNDTLVFNYNQSSFGFSFTGIEYANPEKIKYACRLDGFNTEWLYLNNRRTVNYGHVPPGTYAFMVRAANSDGVWSNSSQVTIIVKPPFTSTIYAYGLYLVIILLILYVIYRYSLERKLLRNRLDYEHKERERIEELNQLKLRLFTHISHEFRTPLSLIIAPVQELLSRYAKKGAQSKELETIHSNANKLKVLVNQVLELRKIESGAIQLKKSPLDLVALIKSSCESFHHWARQKKIQLSFNTSKDKLLINLDQGLIEKVIYNLLSNAIKFTQEGSVEVSLNVQDQKCLIKISDSGVGISQDDQKRLFDMFYRAEDSELKVEGSGVGLALTKEVVELHQGQLGVESELGKGSCFTVSLPYEAIDDQQEVLTKETQDPEKPEENETSQTKLLLVEDNDELRAFLKSKLEQSYHLIEAGNGREALEKAMDQQPQIILSDVMMPEMDGWELCQRIKSDIKVSHIPIVLLTALGESEHIVKGLDIGADAYLSKPFNLDHVESLIRNILRNRELLATKYNQGGTEKIDTSQLSGLDQQLLNDAHQLVVDNINQPDFSVQVLSDHLNMSRVNLHTKLKALCNLAPSDFIMQIRLQEACKLLKTRNYAISEIADLTGFSTASHFSRSFKKQFGGSPSEFLKGKVKI